MTREITHMKAFALALESMGKPAFSIGRIAPTPGLVDQFLNDSSGAGDHGEIDTRGPWNQGGSWEFVEAPAFQEYRAGGDGAEVDDRTTSTAADPGLLHEVLIDHLQDLLNAEEQLEKSLPRLAKA